VESPLFKKKYRLLRSTRSRQRGRWNGTGNSSTVCSAGSTDPSCRVFCDSRECLEPRLFPWSGSCRLIRRRVPNTQSMSLFPFPDLRNASRTAVTWLEPVSARPEYIWLYFSPCLPCYQHDPSPVLRTVRCCAHKSVYSHLCICVFSFSAGCSTLRVGGTHCCFCWTERKQCTPLHIPIHFVVHL
jgi:hypothetical protein